jgi:hypothetical protein
LATVVVPTVFVLLLAGTVLEALLALQVSPAGSLMTVTE